MTAPVQLNDGIRLLSGVMFDYNDPSSCEVTVRDIAGALSKICRFAGHIHQFYSVAQHSVNVSLIVPPEHAFSGLMHDTAEAFTNDLPTPLKHTFPVFKELEHRIEAAMSARFGFVFPLSPQIKVADLQMLDLEKVYLKGDLSNWDCLDGIDTDAVEHLVDLSPWTPGMAEAAFLERYWELNQGIAQGRAA